MEKNKPLPSQDGGPRCESTTIFLSFKRKVNDLQLSKWTEKMIHVSYMYIRTGALIGMVALISKNTFEGYGTFSKGGAYWKEDAN